MILKPTRSLFRCSPAMSRSLMPTPLALKPTPALSRILLFVTVCVGLLSGTRNFIRFKTQFKAKKAPTLHFWVGALYFYSATRSNRTFRLTGSGCDAWYLTHYIIGAKALNTARMKRWKRSVFRSFLSSSFDFSKVLTKSFRISRIALQRYIQTPSS